MLFFIKLKTKTRKKKQTNNTKKKKKIEKKTIRKEPFEKEGFFGPPREIGERKKKTKSYVANKFEIYSKYLKHNQTLMNTKKKTIILPPHHKSERKMENNGVS